MRLQDHAIAKQLRERLSQAVPLIDCRVFVSGARGTQDAYFDMDVFIEVTSLDRPLKEKILDIVWEVGFDNLLLISPLVFTRDGIENSPPPVYLRAKADLQRCPLGTLVALTNQVTLSWVR